MSKKIFIILFIIFCSFCIINCVSAAGNETVTLKDSSDDVLQSNVEDTYQAIDEDDILTHDSDYPFVEFNSPDPNAKVSGIVDIDLYVDTHYELKYANISVENVNTRTVVFQAQDTNPSDGWGFSWDTSNVANGKYYITAYVINVLDLDDTYSILVTLNNQEKNTNIVLDNSVGVVGQSNSIVAHLLDGNSKALSNKNIEFSIDGETYSATTGADGSALISFTPSEVKNYDIIAKFIGDNLYSASQSSTVFKTQSNTNATIITITNITGNNKQFINLKANLKAPGFAEDSANKEIIFYINGKKVGSALTNANGDAELNYNISEVGGRYTYSVEYTDANEDVFKAFSTLFVPESEIYVTMISNKSNVKVGDQFKITYTLYNNGPDNSSNVKFVYTIVDSLKYIKSTSTIGDIQYNKTTKEFMWIIDELPLGNQTLDMIFESVSVARNNLTAYLLTDTYDKSVANGVPTRYLTVKSYAKLTASDLTKYYLGSEKFKVYLYGDDGKLVGAGQSVKITLNKKIYNLKTNKNGYAELKITLKDGKYAVKVNSNNLSISRKIVVKPTLITKNLSKKKAKVTKFTAKVLNTKGKAVASKKVTFKLKSKKYTAKTNKKGVAAISLKNLKTGKYFITTYYGKSTVKNIIIIK